jgi:uncharacterized protein (TIGR00251 family)
MAARETERERSVGPMEVADGEVYLRVRAMPNAGRNAVVGVRSGELVVKLQAPAQEGRANRELVRFLAARLGVSRSAVELVSGESSRHKRLRLPRGTDGAVRALYDVSD